MLSIIIPCYNEGWKLKQNILKIHEFMKGKEYEIICVNDGSTDDTLKCMNEITNIKVVSYEKNRGKGFAVKTGIESSSGDRILFMDADLSTGLNAINLALQSESDIIIGSRTNSDSDVEGKTFIRNLSSYISNLIIRVLIGISYRDTQCGFKMLTRNAASLIVRKQKIERWAFDVEWLYIAKLNNLSVKEIPVVWKDDRDSKVKLIKSSISFFNETLNIRKNKNKYYN